MKDTVVKVLICDDTADHGVRLASSLRDKGIYAYTRRKDENVIFNSILSDTPDVVVSDLSLNDTDAVCIMEKVRAVLSKCPQFVIISDVQNKFVERQVIDSGAAYVMAMPVEPQELYNVIKSVAIKNNIWDSDDAELIVTDLIRSLGVPAHIKGYRYIRTAILECLTNSERIESVTKNLYPRVAEIYNTTSSRVERAIRHAISAAWDRGDVSAMNSFFGCSIESFHSRPTNSEFIALAADRIGLHLKNYGNREKYTIPESQTSCV